MLRQEILQAQQARTDLLKWKLGLVGVIGTAGLGLAGFRASAHADLVLCAVPFVCVYVDLLCQHLSLRILVIGTFFHMPREFVTEDEQADAAVYRRYEKHAQKVRALKPGGGFVLEDWALTGSTTALSISVLLYGTSVRAGVLPDHVPAGWAFIVSGILGLVIGIGGHVLFKIKEVQVAKLVDEGPHRRTLWVWLSGRLD